MDETKKTDLPVSTNDEELTEDQKEVIIDYIIDRYESLIENLSNEVAGYLNAELSVAARDEVEMLSECVMLDILKDKYEDDEEDKKEENIN